MLRALPTVVLGTLMATSARAQGGLRLEPVIARLEQPVLVGHAGDGNERLFVVEQPGRS